MSNPNGPALGACGILVLLMRLLVGGAFIYMGGVKALDPASFLKLVHQYDLVQTPLLLNLIAAGLPWLETFCGLLLVLGVAVRGTALLVVLMLVPFTGIVLRHALQLYTGGNLPFCAIKFDCGCGSGEVFICRKLSENALLTAGALWMVLRRRHWPCLWPRAR